ncbi:hypothetical protein V6N11_069114 [Hibiscus sabdariffa]|uniref:Uncharacterized protein n=2 Tax=Hibiscus sabdariffa TaxID=183260 RepID=A0ABR2BC67_9ROSI
MFKGDTAGRRLIDWHWLCQPRHHGEEVIEHAIRVLISVVVLEELLRYPLVFPYSIILTVDLCVGKTLLTSFAYEFSLDCVCGSESMCALVAFVLLLCLRAVLFCCLRHRCCGVAAAVLLSCYRCLRFWER